MSIFTRLNLFIALAVFSVIAFVVFVEQNHSVQDKLIQEYRLVAQKENTLNRLQANVLEERVAALAFRNSSNFKTLDEISLRESIIREQLAQARALKAAPVTILNEFNQLEREYDVARKAYIEAVSQIQGAAKDAITLKVNHNNHEHSPMHDALHDNLKDSLAVLAHFPTYNSPVKAIEEELDRLIATHEQQELKHIEQLASLITYIQEQHAVSQEHIKTMDSVGPTLSSLVEKAKLELLDRQNILGPQLNQKVAQVHQSLLLGLVVIALFLLSLVWWSRRAIFKPLNESLSRLRQNQQRLDASNASIRGDLHLDDTDTAAQKPAQQANEIQQLDQMTQSLGDALTLSETSSATLKQQEKQIAELQKREAVDNLVAGMSHNLNNYLQPILLLSQHMNKPDKDAETQQMLSVITESAINARNVLDKVLAFSRADAREQPANTESLKDVIALARSTARTNEMIDAAIQPYPQPFVLAASDLNTIVLNLVNNSLDSRDALTPIRIWISGKFVNTHYQVTILDEGSGMDASTLAKAMNKFFTTKPVGQGTGLGLSEARELMEAAGGQLEITSTLGVGTTVSLSIPFRPHMEPTDG